MEIVTRQKPQALPNSKQRTTSFGCTGVLSITTFTTFTQLSTRHNGPAAVGCKRRKPVGTSKQCRREKARSNVQLGRCRVGTRSCCAQNRTSTASNGIVHRVPIAIVSNGNGLSEPLSPASHVVGCSDAKQISLGMIRVDLLPLDIP
jgi:hypothetical protein